MTEDRLAALKEVKRSHLDLKPSPWCMHLPKVLLHKCEGGQAALAHADNASAFWMYSEVIAADLQPPTQLIAGQLWWPPDKGALWPHPRQIIQFQKHEMVLLN